MMWHHDTKEPPLIVLNDTHDKKKPTIPLTIIGSSLVARKIIGQRGEPTTLWLLNGQRMKLIPHDLFL